MEGEGRLKANRVLGSLVLDLHIDLSNLRREAHKPYIKTGLILDERHANLT